MGAVSDTSANGSQRMDGRQQLSVTQSLVEVAYTRARILYNDACPWRNSH